MIASDFDNGYDNWAPDNNTDNITYSDNPGKDSQKSQIFIADYRYDLGEQIVDLNVGMSQMKPCIVTTQTGEIMISG